MTIRSETQQANPATVRLLKIIVIGLAVLIFAGLGAVGWRIVHLASGRAIAPKQVSSTLEQSSEMRLARPLADIALTLPDGAEVGALALEGDRLAVHYRSTSENGIAIVDLTSGREISRVRLGPAASR